MTAPDSRIWGPPPRVLVIVSVVVLCVCTALAVDGAVRTGITTDEPIHVMRLRNFFETGWYALDWDYSGDGPGSHGTNTLVYAPVTMLLLHGWSVLWGVEGWGQVATTPHAYDVRHLGVVVIGLVGVAGVAVIGRLVLRHWRWGIVAAAVLAAIPMWTGHQMVNVKDVPVATGYTLTTLGLLCFVRQEPAGWALRLGRAACLVAGLILTLGTRPGMWPGLVAVGAVAALGLVLGSRTRRAATIGLIEMTAAAAVAAGALVALYPNLFGSPLHSLPRTTESSSSFLGGERSDRLYVVRHVAEEMPTLLLGFVLTGAVVGAVLVCGLWRNSTVQSARIALVGVQAFALPLVAIAMDSDLYHGLRQLLFAAPAAAVLGVYGMAWWQHRTGPRLGPLWAAAALVLPVVDQVTLQPYQTTYANLAADVVSSTFADGDRRPGGDFWRVSLPELIKGAALDRQFLCKSKVDEESNVSFPFTNAGEAFSTSRSLDCRDEVNGPVAPLRLPLGRASPDDEYDAVFLKEVPENCTALNEVTRERHGFDVVLTILARCTVEVPDLTSAGSRYDDAALGTGSPSDLWRMAVAGWEQWPGGELVSPVPTARIAFRPADSCGGGCTLVIRGQSPADLVVTLAGERVPTSRGANGTVGVPISARQATDAHGVWVTLTRRSGGTLGMRLTALSLKQQMEGPA